MTPKELPVKGDIVTPNGTVWAVVEEHIIYGKDRATYTIELARLGPVDDRAATVSERVTTMPPIARLVLQGVPK